MLRVGLLGEPALELDGRPLKPPSSRAARALLGWLALHPGTHPRVDVAAQLWPGDSGGVSRARLRTTVGQLRRALGTEGSRALIASSDLIGLRDDELWVDARTFEEHVAEGRLVEALQLCSGAELLAGLDDDWVRDARDRHSASRLAVLERLAVRAHEAGDRDGAVRWTREQVELDPLSEERNRALFQRLADAGDRPGVMVAYELLKERLRYELRVMPSDETQALIGRLRRE